MKTNVFCLNRSYCCIVAFLILFTSCKKATVPNEDTTGFSTNKRMANSQTLSAGGSLRKVGYLTLHSVGGSDFDTYIDSFVTSQYTDIIIAFLNPDASGNFTITTNVTQAITKAHNAGLRIYFGTGTVEANGNANNLINNNRADFISKIRKFTTINNFDGVDLDFEGAGLTSNFSPFVVQLSDSLHLHSKLLSVALAAYQASVLSTAAYSKLDFLNVMSYDHGTNQPGAKPHSSFSDFVTDFNTCKLKISPSKINMGVPTYAWVYDNNAPTTQIGYSNVIQAKPSGHCVNTVSLTATRKVFYDGHPVIRQKIPFALQQGIGGIMIWHVLSDTKDDATSIIKFINYCETNPSCFYPGTYRLSNISSGKPIQIAAASNADGAAVVQGMGDSQGSYLWRFNYVSGINYGIINNYTNKAMNVNGASIANNAPLIQWPWSNQAANQQFKLEPDASGLYTITAVHSNKPIQILNASSADGAQVVQSSADGGYNQKWFIWR